MARGHGATGRNEGRGACGTQDALRRTDSGPSFDFVAPVLAVRILWPRPLDPGFQAVDYTIRASGVEGKR